MGRDLNEARDQPSAFSAVSGRRNRTANVKALSQENAWPGI